MYIPDEVLVLPVRADTSNLEDKDTIVVEEVVHLAEEGLVATDADVLGHLQADNLGVRATPTGDVAGIRAQDASALRVTALSPT